jgi:hypothetical protein
MALASCPRWATTVRISSSVPSGFTERKLAFNAFGCDYNAASVLAVAQAMHDTGLVAAGYNVCPYYPFIILNQTNRLVNHSGRLLYVVKILVPE